MERHSVLDSKQEFDMKKHIEELRIKNLAEQEYNEMLNKEQKKAPKNYSSTGLKLNNYVDNVLQFYNNQPFFYDKQKMFWLWNNTDYRYELTDETDLLKMIDENLSFGGQLVTSKVKNNYLESFRIVGRGKIPKDPPESWVQFKNKIVDLKSKKIFCVNPDFFITNPIPRNIGLSVDTPIIHKLFVDWVGEDKAQTLYEIVAYCCLNAYPVHILFALIGSGRNGKSRFLELLNRFIGRSNVTSTELDTLLTNRFESAKLYKKLVCVMGETNFDTIKRTSLLKKLSGQDLIGYEFKNKNPFDDYNYAKIIIASNSLPSSDDTSEGFYRRWMIIKFPNDFPEGKDILEAIPEEEYDNLARKVIKILPELLEKGKFTNQGSIEDRKKNYIAASNPLTIFINAFCDQEENLYIRYEALYNHYLKYLTVNKHRVVSKKEFSNILNREGFIVERTTKNINGEFVNSRWVYGLCVNYDRLNSYYNV